MGSFPAVIAFPTACSLTWHFLPPAYTAKDVSVKSRNRERALGFGCGNCPCGSSGCWVERGSPGWEEVPLGGSLHPLSLLLVLRLGRLSPTPEAKGGWLGAGGRALFPRLSGHITLSPPARDAALSKGLWNQFAVGLMGQHHELGPLSSIAHSYGPDHSFARCLRH